VTPEDGASSPLVHPERHLAVSPDQTAEDKPVTAGALRRHGSALHFALRLVLRAPWKDGPSAADLTVRRRLGSLDGR
jgi:hypothetical protein